MRWKERAQTAIATKLAEALWREDIGDARRRFSGEVHAFDRVVLGPVERDPVTLVDDERLRQELASAVTGLTLAYERHAAQDEQRRAGGADDMIALAARQAPDRAMLMLEQLATEGHNLHPCGRTRLGWSLEDMRRHDLETTGTHIHFAAVAAQAAPGDDLGELLGVAAPAGHRVLPVHAWQLEHLRRDHELTVLDEVWPAWPTAAIRTLLTRDDLYLKVSLDIQVTSTRRTISLASTRNGPTLSRLIAERIDSDRIMLLPEIAGAAGVLGSGRDLSTIVRKGLGTLMPGEVAVPGSALPAADPITGHTVLDGLVKRHGGGPMAFFAEYAELLVPVVLRLAADHGVGLEAHLQNCVPTFVAGRPHRIAFRDFAGLRVVAQPGLTLWPGSVIGTDDRAVMLAKVGYTVFQAHLGELVLRLGLDPDAAWRTVRAVVDQALDGHPDHAFYTAPTMPHKALTRMRLAGHGDLYIPVRNPLHG